MTASEKTINLILNDLTSVKENLISLSEDIWSSIDYKDQEQLDEGYQFVTEFNHLLESFEENSAAISTLITQFTGIKTIDENQIVSKDTNENKRNIQELNKDIPHSITENFTYKQPYAFTFEGCAYMDKDSWSSVYVQFVFCLMQKNPDLLYSLADNPDFISKKKRKFFSKTPNDFIRPKEIREDFFIESNLSARDLTKKIIELLEYFNLSKDSITIYLNKDRNA